MATNHLWTPKKVKIGAFLLCFFIAGIPFWSIPYTDVTVPNSFFGIGILVAFVAAAVLASRFGFIQGLVNVGSVFPAVLMVRVVVEGIMEPSRHNLWPLALIIAVILGLIVAGAGATLGWLVSRFLGQGSREDC
ncbi:MAG: hypothetical protein AB7U63_00505 [Porticoccaceae bacterium]|jgi:hypothetical protein